MRLFSISLVLLFFYYQLCAQNSSQANVGSDENLKELAHNIFEYPSFVEGIIILKDSSQYVAKLNYNRILGKFLVIDRIGNTRPFADPDKIDKIIVKADTFYYSNDKLCGKAKRLRWINTCNYFGWIKIGIQL